jgi:1-acyl-sn-glycerol-3-phosphate acyltransferase
LSASGFPTDELSVEGPSPLTRVRSPQWSCIAYCTLCPNHTSLQGWDWISLERATFRCEISFRTIRAGR